jgi:hypothetical protein
MHLLETEYCTLYRKSDLCIPRNETAARSNSYIHVSVNDYREQTEHYNSVSFLGIHKLEQTFILDSHRALYLKCTSGMQNAIQECISAIVKFPLNSRLLKGRSSDQNKIFFQSHFLNFTELSIISQKKRSIILLDLGGSFLYQLCELSCAGRAVGSCRSAPVAKEFLYKKNQFHAHCI